MTVRFSLILNEQIAQASESIYSDRIFARSYKAEKTDCTPY